jgi:GLPGLI family protein
MKQTIFIVGFFVSIALQAQQTRIISDCTLSFAVKSSKQADVGSKVIYIKGKNIRVDFISNIYSQSIISGETGGATILKTVGQSKYIANYSSEEWKKQNDIYSGIETSVTSDTKKILDYACKKAVLTLKNGTDYTVYYVPWLVPSVNENPFEFKDVPGLVLEYESSANNEKVTYTAIKIDFNPVPAAQFEIPKAGYRILH